MVDLRGKKCYAAVDIGASSGRVYLGWVEDGRLRAECAHRFENSQRRVNGHDCWDVGSLADEVIAGLASCKESFGAEPASVGIDTWGVDYVLLDAEGGIVGDTVAYRDARTAGMLEAADKIMPAEELYMRTGIQRNPINTIYQLLAQRLEHPDQLEAAQRFLMVPDYLNFVLTGIAANEYTNASTTGMLDARACDWDPAILEAFGIPARLFETPTMPGTVLGAFTPAIAARVGYQSTVVLVASHDTGSAFLAAPAKDEDSVCISSGTWSLIGVELAEPITTPVALSCNFTNEGGFRKRYRFLKNIMGLWINQSVRREYNGVDYVEGKTDNTALADHRIDFGEMVQAARDAHGFTAYVDVDDERFLAPISMIKELRAACTEAGQPVPQTLGEIMRTIYCSLSRSYAEAVRELEGITGRTYTSICLVGGGGQDEYLDELTAQATGLPVYVGPTEGTCFGNFEVQLIADGTLDTVQQARDLVARSFQVKVYEPEAPSK